MKHLALIFAICLGCVSLCSAAEVIPAPPARHIVDQAGVLSPGTLEQLNQQLVQFERDTTAQVVVAIYPKMQSSDDIAPYAARVFTQWKIGAKGKDNGVLLLIFTQDRKLNITTGYGMEGNIPDATASAIIEDDIKPHLKTGDFNSALRAGVGAILQAARGEYKFHAPTTANPPPNPGAPGAVKNQGGQLKDSETALIIFLVVVILFISIFGRSRRGTFYSSGRSSSWGGGFSGGGFSGGGGRTGGGGASGSW